MSELPKITTTENILGVLTSPQGDGIAAMMCTTTWGPLDEVQSVNSLSDFKKKYGTDDSTISGYKAAKAFFNNGGVLKVLRVGHTGYAKATKTFADTVAADALIITGKYNGTYGDNITVTITANGSNVNVFVSDGLTTEPYYNLATNAAIVTAINTGSLCTAAVASGSPVLVAAITATYLTGGDDGITSLADTDYTTALDSYLDTEDYTYLLVPGETADAFQATIMGKLDTRAVNEEKYSRYITGITASETIATIKARTLSGRRTTLCAPSLVLDDETLDGSYLACALAGKLCNLQIGIAGTNKTLVGDVDTTYTKPEQSELLDDSICVIGYSNSVLKCIKDLTRYNDLTSPYKLGVVCDEIDYARTQYEAYLRGQLGQPNSAINRASISNNLDRVSSTLIGDGVIETANTAEVLEGSSSDSISASITIKPVYSIDYIELILNVQ